jgi:hypothetical protein
MTTKVSVVNELLSNTLVSLFSGLRTEDFLEMGDQDSLRKGRISCFFFEG